MAASSEILSGIRVILTEMGLNGYKDDINSIKESMAHMHEAQGKMDGELKAAQAELNSVKIDSQTLKSENVMLKDLVEFSGNRLSALESELKTCNEKILDGQVRSMKDNLVFHGIAESRGEITRSVLVKFLKEDMQIADSRFKIPVSLEDETDDSLVWIHRAHRFGKPSVGGTPRPIVAKMTQITVKT